MQASALPKPERVNQVWLGEAMALHENYLQGIHGGQRLFRSFKDGRHLDFSGARLRNADLRHARVDGAKFVDCNLSGAALRGTAIELADLRGAVGVRS